VLGSSKTERLIAALQSLETLDDMRRLRPLFTA
jgi:hypothetical protein